MKLLVVLTGLLAVCLADRPHPCTTPPLLSGELTVSTQNEKLWTFAQYEYDALGQRLRLKEFGSYENKTFTFDALLHFREATMYEINDRARTCKKVPLKDDFHPWAVPQTASLLAQVIVGSSSGPLEGLLVNTWAGDLPKGGKYMTTVTEFGCIPVSTVYQTEQFGWMLISFINNVKGLTDPGQLNAPSYCPSADVRADSGQEPADLISLFLKKH